MANQTVQAEEVVLVFCRVGIGIRVRKIDQFHNDELLHWTQALLCCLPTHRVAFICQQEGGRDESPFALPFEEISEEKETLQDEACDQGRSHWTALQEFKDP